MLWVNFYKGQNVKRKHYGACDLLIISTIYLPLFCYVSVQELYSSGAAFVARLRHIRHNYAILIQRLLQMWPTNAAFQFEGCTTWILRGPAYIKMHRGPTSSLSSSDKILAGYTLESARVPFYDLAFIFSQRLETQRLEWRYFKTTLLLSWMFWSVPMIRDLKEENKKKSRSDNLCKTPPLYLLHENITCLIVSRLQSIWIVAQPGYVGSALFGPGTHNDAA